MSLLAPLKMPIDKAVELLRDCIALVQGHDLRRVCQFYVDNGMLGIKRITFREWTEIYLQKEFASPRSKKGSDNEILHLCRWLCKEMGDENVLLVDVTRDVLNKYVNGRPELVAYESKHHAHEFLITVFRLAKKKEYLPWNLPTAADRVDAPVEKRGSRPPVSIIWPDVLRKLIDRLWILRRDHIRYEGALYCVILGVFLGIRRCERTRTKWEYFDLARALVCLPAEATKDKRYREIPIPPNVMAFIIAMGGKKTGLVLGSAEWAQVPSEVMREMNMTLPSNGFRKAFATFWNIIVWDKELLAKIMGTSVEKLNRRYIRKEVTVDLGLIHFGIYPPGYSGPVVTGDELITALRGKVNQSWAPTSGMAALPPAQPLGIPPVRVLVAPVAVVPTEVKDEAVPALESPVTQAMPLPAPTSQITVPVITAPSPTAPVVRPGREAALAQAAAVRELQLAYEADKKRQRQEHKRLKRQRRRR
jgi:hypothetical protein